MNQNEKLKDERTGQNEKMTGSLQKDLKYLNEKLKVDVNFDVVYRIIHIGGREACIYFIDGFCKDDMMQKMLQYFMSVTPEEMPANAHEMSKQNIPHVEVDINDKWDTIIY